MLLDFLLQELLSGGEEEEGGCGDADDGVEIDALPDEK